METRRICCNSCENAWARASPSTFNATIMQCVCLQQLKHRRTLARNLFVVDGSLSRRWHNKTIGQFGRLVNGYTGSEKIAKHFGFRSLLVKWKHRISREETVVRCKLWRKSSSVMDRWWWWRARGLRRKTFSSCELVNLTVRRKNKYK